MSLLMEKLENFAVQLISQTDDGLGMAGEVLTDGDIFQGTLVLKTSTQAQIAYQQGYRQIYSLLHTGIKLSKEMRVKHLKSGRIYRITGDSDDMSPPGSSDLSFSQVSCEVIEV